MCDHWSPNTECDQSDAMPETKLSFHALDQWHQLLYRPYILRTERISQWNWIKKSFNLPNIPEENGSIRTTATEKLFVKWMPRKTRCFLFVSTESLQFLIQSSDVKQFDQMISRGRDEPLAVLIPFCVHNRALVCM